MTSTHPALLYRGRYPSCYWAGCWISPSERGMLDEPQLTRYRDKSHWRPYAAWAPVKAVFWVRPSGGGMLDKAQWKSYAGWAPWRRHAIWAPFEAVCWMNPLKTSCCMSPIWNCMLDEPPEDVMLYELHLKLYVGWAPWRRHAVWSTFEAVCWINPLNTSCCMSPIWSCMLDDPHCKQYKQNDPNLPTIQCLSSNPQTKPKPNKLLQLVPRSWQYWL
jgi:hypothetical protein